MMFLKGMRGWFGSTGCKNKQIHVSMLQLAEAPADNYGAGCWLPRKGVLATIWNLPAGCLCYNFSRRNPSSWDSQNGALLLVPYKYFISSSKIKLIWNQFIHKFCCKSAHFCSFTLRERKHDIYFTKIFKPPTPLIYPHTLDKYIDLSIYIHTYATCVHARTHTPSHVVTINQ